MLPRPHIFDRYLTLSYLTVVLLASGAAFAVRPRLFLSPPHGSLPHLTLLRARDLMFTIAPPRVLALSRSHAPLRSRHRAPRAVHPAAARASGSLARADAVPSAQRARYPTAHARARRALTVSRGSTDAVSTVASSAGAKHASLALTVAALFALDKSLERALCAAGVAFPSALVGMFGALVALLVAEKIGGEDCANGMKNAFAPALSWITSWLPVFYVPSLVVIPLVVTKIAPSALVKVLSIIVIGFVATICFSATSASVIRKATGTTMLPVAPAKGAAPTESYVYTLWGTIFAVSVAATLLGGANASGAKVAAMVSATVCSFLVGSLPQVKAKMNPIVTTAALTNVAAAALGALTGDGWMKMLSLYRTGVPFGLETFGRLGAGDILMTFLGSVILSFAFKVFEARRIIARHAVEIFGCLISTSLFGMFSTAIAGKYLGLSAALSAALVPRSVTVALAIPVTTLLGHPEMVPVTAAGVVLTGLIGSSLCVPILNKIGAKDPITRGMATAASAHGLGTAALAGGEPEALPFAALAYALSGILASVIAAIPFIQRALLAIIA